MEKRREERSQKVEKKRKEEIDTKLTEREGKGGMNRVMRKNSIAINNKSIYIHEGTSEGRGRAREGKKVSCHSHGGEES